MELIALLFAAGLVVLCWPVIVGVIALVVAAYLTRRAMESHSARVDAERRRLAGLVDRADRQHNWVMQGDARGTYGDYPVAGT